MVNIFQMRILKRKIQESEFLESDDDNFVEFLKKISGEEVSLKLSEFVDLEELEYILKNYFKILLTCRKS